MKALTICQPYAELIARGEKRVENRTWSTNYRGPLLIHAGKSRSWLDGETNDELREEYGREIEFGAVVATATLVDCLRAEPIMDGIYEDRHPGLQRHVHVSGPWCWVLADVKRLPAAVPWKGEQGLFVIPDSAVQPAGES